ncbi:BMP family lipoprotein [Myceligenerans pegani]|uniref:BMP family ABC transporter substrate-binding protein n=1 Tax=Myceligenerans pegani TaxID=2776917 RepID=A0ABR9N1Y9_9MICO|nr:BMP family ABC transporter substrate-binding protein [Myceligenerans sp. TRM 65318]MBE1877103.1 BMP family ABC transporter substrate-binding protein [Myceligenerans sp. TRM 65318]MBE3019374.1 BMP family ABC transporter substrate-binding protein [Myceligenerans sp. TRM 65318]
MKKAVALTALTGAAALALSACGAAPEETGGNEAASDFLPCIVSDEGGFDDKSFNQLSYEGVQAAATAIGAEVRQVESNSETEYQGNVQSLVDEGCDAIVTVGFALSAATIESATANPDINYILIDDPADADQDGETDAENIKPLLYNTAEAAFLAGYLAAGYSETGKVGTFGGMEFPTVTIFMDGFKQGVDHYNEVKDADVEVVGWNGETGVFTGGFAANNDAKNTATNVIGQGVDVLLPVGGPIYQSAIDAIEDSGKDIALIGVDADLYETDPATQDLVLTSILKGMDVSTQEAVEQAAAGSFDPTPYIGTLENDGVGLAPLHNFEDDVDPELMAEVDALRQSIIAGEVEVKSYLAE